MIRRRATRTRPESCHYRLAWDRTLLGWVLTYDTQIYSTISAFLPGRPQMDAKAARVWADEVLKHPQQWQTVITDHTYRAVPAP